ncbi:MAG: hypothetical protein HY319_02645 [Armatimonadetes bacterium]|nr:hypothetical protein [Armatimonadota bacterium]
MTSSKDTGREKVWTWVSLGIGTGILVAVMAGLGYRYLEQRRSRKRDPRAAKVQELILEAERLLAQGRKARST